MKSKSKYQNTIVSEYSISNDQVEQKAVYSYDSEDGSKQDIM